MPYVIAAISVVQVALIALAVVFFRRMRALDRMSARDFPAMTEDRFSLWLAAQRRKWEAFMLVAGGLLVLWLIILLSYFTSTAQPSITLRPRSVFFFLTAMYVLVAALGLGYAWSCHRRARELEENR